MDYQEALEDQNNGGHCKHCGSASGHYAVCPLLNRNSAEHHSAATAHYIREAKSAALFAQNVADGLYRKERVIASEFTEADKALLAEMKITL